MAEAFGHNVLELADPEATIDSIANGMRAEARAFRRKGAVLGLSGGIDSSVVAALAARAFGPGNVLGVLMPEADSSDDTLMLSRLAAESQGIETALEEITPILDAAGCYRRRDEAFKRVIPAYGPGWKAKIVLPSVLESDAYRIFSVVAQGPDGTTVKERLPLEEYLQVVAATNFKQRTRKMLEYYHADRLNYVVLGTPNRLEYDQGFFVKNGDGSADIKPIAHLYKSQVYQLAAALGVPAEISSRPPTTDTYSMPQSQEEFYFSLPYHSMDLCLYAVDNGVLAADVAKALELTEEQVERVFKDIAAKRRVSQYLHAVPVTLAEGDA
ncbi:MAG: NAD(+) synthase [Trueperaceae bacterium]